VYRHPYFEKMGFKAGYCPEAERYFGEALSIPMFPTLNNSQQDQVVSALRTAIES
jgi:dTDP-4-amino-4,6-dideoxygalactose transaminase